METRETRDFAREIKFKTTLERWPDIVRWSRANLQPDGHGAGEHADEYQTCSLYFETPKFDVYRRSGSYGKSKFRIRRYGSAPIMFLERKFRTERVLIKRRTTAALEDFRRIELHEPDPEWYGYWFHRRLLARRLKPLVQVSYVRTARLGSSPHGKVRMTLDSQLRVLPLPDGAFLPGVGLPLMEESNIIEIKYCVTLPPVFREVISQFSLRMQPVSKYRAGLALLGLSPTPTQG